MINFDNKCLQMSFQRLFQFLGELQENNHKEWMDENRPYYHSVRDWYIGWLDEMSAALAAVDKDYTPTSGRKCINRINNNLLFHPNKPVYKDHFGAGLDQLSKQGDFYIHMGVNEIFIAGGYYRPQADQLSSLRAAIDYNGEELKKILNKPSFKKEFGGLIETDDKLATTPKGYTADHPHIDLLRYKTLAVETTLSRADVLSPNFEEQLIKIYKEMLPFRRYLNKAVTV